MASERARTLVVLLTVVAALLAASPGGAAASGISQVTVRVGRPVLAVPSSFIGVSVEQNELLLYDRYRSAFLRLLHVLQPSGDGSPLVLRIGGRAPTARSGGRHRSRWSSPPTVRTTRTC